MRPFQEGYFEYNECFLGEGGFLAPDANEEKHMMGYYLESLAGALSRRKVVFGGDEPVRWLEPGLGDGSSTRRFLQAVGRIHPAGFIVYGSDYQIQSVEQARSNLSSIPETKVQIAAVKVADAFSGEALASEPCDFALMSHFIYHLKNQLDGFQITDAQAEEQLIGLINAIMSSLRFDGLALAFHEGPASDMFGNIGRVFGSAMTDATERIAQAAFALGKTVVRMPLESKLYFPDLAPQILEELKELRTWHRYDDGTPEASWVKKVLFALHNTPLQGPDGKIHKEGGVRDLVHLSAPHANATRLGDLIDHVVDLFQHDEVGPHITIRSEMQAIVNTPELGLLVEAAFAEVEGCLPEIRSRTRQALLSAAKDRQAVKG